jgi:predicted nuclease of restriction endonuclease-like (RecB) superfamily
MTKKARRVSVVQHATFYERIRRILASARATVARSVNTTQVVANWLIGWEIVEEEQRGHSRAEYGESLLKGLSVFLQLNFGRGYSVDNLERFRNFYQIYPDLLGPQKSAAARRICGAMARDDALAISRKKSAAVRRISGAASADEIPHAARGDLTRLGNVDVQLAEGVDSWQPGQLHPNLSWTHYRALLRVDSANARGFYEIESIRNNWSARELERQINSLLYARLARSRDKKGLMRLATKGQEISAPADVFKDPVVIEFLGLPESPKLVESDLEIALLDNLQVFLLELGKGFAFVARQQRITLDGDHFYNRSRFLSHHSEMFCVDRSQGWQVDAWRLGATSALCQLL